MLGELPGIPSFIGLVATWAQLRATGFGTEKVSLLYLSSIICCLMLVHSQLTLKRKIMSQETPKRSKGRNADFNLT